MEVDASRALEQWETGSDLRGYRLVPAAPVAAVLVVHGLGEHAARHATTMRRFAARGLAAYAYDHRGHGNSPGARATIARLDDLIDASLALRERVAAEHRGVPLFLFGASMGGLIAVRSVQRVSDGVRGLVLLAPAFAVGEHIPKPVQRVLRVLRRFAPGLPLAPLAPGTLSRDPAVGEAYRADSLTHHGGVPLCSAIEIVEGGEAALAQAASFAVPTLLFQGDADRIVFPIGAERFAKAAKSNRDFSFTAVPGGYHELFNDPGGDALADAAADWMLARSGGASAGAAQ